MTIRIALLGAGIMGADHARIVAGDLPGTRLQVVCDASVDRARRVADDRGAEDVATDPVAVIGRRDEEGRFKDSEDVGRSSAQDQKRDAKTKPTRGEGDRGDR